MFLTACVLAMLPAAGSAPHPTAHAVTADGKLLFVAMGDATNKTGFVCVWDLTKPELRAVVPGTPGTTRLIQPTSVGTRFVVCGGDKIEVYDTATKKLLHTFDGSAQYGSEVAVSPDGAWIAVRARAEKADLKVWSTETGKRAAEVEKAAGGVSGTVAFAGAKLVIASKDAYAEFAPATGKKVGGWKPAEPVGRTFLEGPGQIAVLPNGKGMVSVAGTGKRRQSYVINLITEKKTWFLGEAWDRAGPPVLSPDGRLLILHAGARAEGSGTFALKLGADGAPELTDLKDDKGPFWGAVDSDNKRPAWRTWALGDTGGAGRLGRTVPDRDWPGPLTFAPDGKRLFVGGTLGRVAVFDLEARDPKATLFAGPAVKDELPAWHIVTGTGAVVGSPAEVEALVKSGKVKDAAKVKTALGTK